MARGWLDRILLRLVALRVLAGVLATVACAADATAAARAIVVGISSYTRTPAGVEQLRYAHRDAEAFREFLRTPGGGGITDDRVRLLTNEAATRDAIYDAINWLESASPEDTVYIFFAGHGVVDKHGIAYLMPVDARFDAPNVRGIAAAEFLREIDTRSNGRHLVAFIDACHAGAAEKGMRSLQPSIQEELSEAWETVFRNQESTSLALFSASRAQKAWESEALGAGVFTHFLLRALRGEADVDRDRVVVAGEAYQWILREVRDFTSQHHKVQTPVASASFNDRFPLALLGQGVLGPTPPAPSTPKQASDTPFPLLPDFRSRSGAPLDAEARDDLQRVRMRLEAHDWGCGYVPGDERSSRVVDQLAVLDAYYAADRSVRKSPSAWGKFYRGAALAQLRAFDAAIEDLGDAEKELLFAGEQQASMMAGRFRGLVTDWRRIANAPVPLPPSRCDFRTSTTVCELSARMDHWSLTPAEEREAVVLFESLVSSPCTGTCVDAGPLLRVNCAIAFAAMLRDPALAARAYRHALAGAGMGGSTDLIPGASQALYRRLVRSGDYEGAAEVAGAFGARWERHELAILALEDVFEPAVSDSLLEQSVVVSRLPPDLRDDILRLRYFLRDARGALRELDQVLLATSELSSSDAVRAALDDHLRMRGPITGSEGFRALARAVRGFPLREHIEPLFSAIGRIGRHPAGPMKLVQMLADNELYASRAISLLTTSGWNDGEGLGLLLRLVLFEASVRTGSDTDSLMTRKPVLRRAEDPLPPEFFLEIPTTVELLNALLRSPYSKTVGDTNVSGDAIGTSLVQVENPFTEVVTGLMQCWQAAGARTPAARAAAEECIYNATLQYLDLFQAFRPVLDPVADAHLRAKARVSRELSGGTPATLTRAYGRFLREELDLILSGGRYTPAQIFVSGVVDILLGHMDRRATPGNIVRRGPNRDEDLSTVASLVVRTLRRERSAEVSASARAFLVATRNPILRMAVAALPVTYADLSGERIRSFLNLTGVTSADKGLRLEHLGIYICLIANSSLAKPLLTYDQVEALASFLPSRSAPASYSIWVPVPADPIFAGVSPYAVLQEGCLSRDFEIGLAAGEDKLGAGMSGRANCIDLAIIKLEAVTGAAAAEGRWEEVKQHVESLVDERDLAKTDLHDYFTHVLDRGGTRIPSALKRRIHEVALQNGEQSARQFRRQGGLLSAMIGSLIPGEHVPSAARLLGRIADHVSANPVGDTVSLGDWLDFIDETSDAVRRLNDPALIAGSQRILRTVYGTCVAPPTHLQDAATETLESLEHSVEKGEIRAAVHLATILESLHDTKSRDRAVQLLGDAAKKNDPEAMGKYGALLARRGDRAAAERWLRRAADRGYSDAKADLALMRLRNGRGKPAKAMALLEAAAKEGSVTAMFELGLLQATTGRSRGDIETGHFWLREAERYGNPAAAEVLAQLTAPR